MLEFSLPTNDILLSKIFSSLDDAKATLNLQDYTISQTTLDQVFVNFASQDSHDLLENKNNTANKRRFEGELPYSNVSNGLKPNEIQINETRFNESFQMNDELIQKKPSDLMKSSVYNYQSAKLANQLGTSHQFVNIKSSKNMKTNKIHLNHHSINMKNLNSNGNVNHHLTNPHQNIQTALYFNNQNQQIIAYPTNYHHLNNLTSSNLYCTIGRPQTALYNNTTAIQQPLIILPKTRKK